MYIADIFVTHSSGTSNGYTYTRALHLASEGEWQVEDVVVPGGHSGHERGGEFVIVVLSWSLRCSSVH